MSVKIIDMLDAERKAIIEKLKKIDAEKWKDVKHCTCLKYAIWCLENPDQETPNKEK